MELIKLFADNEMGNTYYNPKFDYLAFEGANGDVIFNKIFDSKVTPKNTIKFAISDEALSEDDPLYSKMLLDDGWNFSDKIIISGEIKNNEVCHYSDIDKYYSWSKKSMEDYVSLLKDYKKYLNNFKYADFSEFSDYF
jgi:hypothetical protein